MLKSEEPTAIYKQNLQNTTIDCFKEGLLPEIDVRLAGAVGTIDQIVEKAVKIKKRLQTQASLMSDRKPSREQRRKFFYYTETKTSETEKEKSPSKDATTFCQLCKKINHIATDCYLYKKTRQHFK